jgi:hypothetical protein
LNTWLVVEHLRGLGKMTGYRNWESASSIDEKNRKIEINKINTKNSEKPSTVLPALPTLSWPRIPWSTEQSVLI